MVPATAISQQTVVLVNDTTALYRMESDVPSIPPLCGAIFLESSSVGF